MERTVVFSGGNTTISLANGTQVVIDNNRRRIHKLHGSKVDTIRTEMSIRDFSQMLDEIEASN